jgi:hypothetical protein
VPFGDSLSIDAEDRSAACPWLRGIGDELLADRVLARGERPGAGDVRALESPERQVLLHLKE